MRDTPFRTSGRVPPHEFFGRGETIRSVVHGLRGKACVAVCGPAHSGKTSLLTLLHKNYRHAEKDVLTWFVDLRNVNSLSGLIDEFYYGMKINSDNTSLRDFASVLRNWKRRFVIFIDNGDRFAAPPFNEEALFAVLSNYLPAQQISMCVATTRSPETLFTNRIGLPLHSFFIRCDMQPFSPEECFQFVQQRLQWTGVYFSESDISGLVIESRGEPAELQRLAADLFRKKMAEGTTAGPGGVSRTAATRTAPRR